MFETKFDPQRVDAREMQTLIDWLQKKTGATLTVQSVIVVSTDRVEVSNMLDGLRDTLSKNGHAAKVSKPKAKKLKADAGNGTMGRASRRIESTGEIVSLVELKKRIAEGTIEEQTKVIDAKGVRFVVLSGMLIQEPGE